MSMYLNVDVRQFRAKSAKLPEIASHPRSNTLSCKWQKVTVKRTMMMTGDGSLRLCLCWAFEDSIRFLRFTFKSLTLMTIYFNPTWGGLQLFIVSETLYYIQILTFKGTQNKQSRDNSTLRKPPFLLRKVFVMRFLILFAWKLQLVASENH